MSQVRKYQEGGITPIKKDNETQVVEQITPVVPGLEEIILKQKTVPTTEQTIVKINHMLHSSQNQLLI